MTKLYSTDAFELLLGISEGEIGGVVGDTPEEKRQNIFIDDTPLYDSTGISNFDDSNLILRFEPGTPFTAIEDAEEGQTPIWYAFGGQNISVAVDRQLDHESAITELTPETTKGFDAIEVRFYIPQLVRYTDDGARSHKLELRIEFRLAGAATWQSVEKTIEGKAAAAPISRAFKFPVARTQPEDRFEIRVTKLTEESTEKKIANVSWVGYELFTTAGNVYTSNTMEYDDPSLEYHPGTAMLQVVGVLGQQLDRVPTISAVYDGLLCTIPSNYDPVTKTYDESVPWDGTFKVEKATTDNPFWIAHELITNTRMGLARHNPRIRVDRYSTYEKAKYADGYNPLTNLKDLDNPLTGENGVARYTFNAVISQQQDGMDLINQIVGTAFGRALDNDDGEIQFLMDMPTTPTAIITPEMCLDDSDHFIQFTYSFSDLNERYNAITSSILDKRQEYQQRFISEIRDEDSISKYGLNQHEFKAVGCTDEWECQRRMYFFMNSVLTEITTVTFRMPLNSIEFERSDVVYLVDPDLKHGLSGRMVYGNVRTIQVRDPLYFDEATDYELTLQGIEQDYVYTITISAEQVHTPITTFTISDDLPAPTEYNEYPVVSISNLPGSETPVGFPKPWRITGISEMEDHAGFHEITAVEINPNKHSAADLLTVSQMPDFSFDRPFRPTKVQNLRVLEQQHIETVDAQQVNLWVGWDEQEDLPAGAYYEVTVHENTRAAAVASFNVQESAVEIPNIRRGEIRIRVVTWFGSLRSGQVFLNYNAENVLVAEMAAQGIAPLFTTSYENDALEVFAELRYNYGSSTVTNIDLIAAGTVQGIRYTVYDDRDPQNRNLLTTLDTNGPLLLGPQDFYKLIGHGDYTPSSLFIEAQVIDVEGSRYPADGQTPFELTVSPDAAPITSLTYTKVLSGTTYHRVTWDDNNYGYEVTLFKPDGKSVLSKTVVYDNEFSFGVLPEGTGYTIQVRGFNSSRAYGNPETVLFNVSREITPTAEPAIVNNEGTIVLTPSEPTSPQASYEFKYGLLDNITSAVDATRGTSVTINNTVNNADYYIWYRLVSLEGKGSWIKKTVKANGQTLYTWKVYADDENGTGISTTADTKPFVGILSGQLVATPDISDPSIYAWLRNTSTEWLFGSGAPSSGIGNIGDSYLEQSTGNIYKKTASGWGDPIGNLQGGDGDKFWSAPYHPDDASNPYQGSNGDLYINTLTFELYQKINDTWTLQGVLKGTDGTPGADGKDAAYFRGFETTEEQDDLQLYTGVTKQVVNDAFSGTVAMELSSTVVDGDTGGNGDTSYLTIPEPLALLFAGQKCLISVIAKQGSGSASPEFGLAYSTSDVGNSGWSRFAPTTSFLKYSFEYELPLPNNGGTDFLIINPDMTGGGGTLIVDHVQITIKGEKGDAGDNAQLYYIGYPNGLVIKNGVGTINLETHLLDGSDDSVLTGSSDPQLYDGSTALGRAASFDTADINGAKVIQLKNGNTVLDSVTVTDLLDGDSAVTGTTSYSNTLAWTQEKNGASAWLPGTYTSDITFTFYKDGATIATRVLRATLTAATGNIAITNVSTSGETTNYAVSSNGTASVSITVTHTSSGVKATESVLSVKSGEKGDDGLSPSVGYLEEEATSFLALADGSLEPGQLPYTNKFTIYEGQADVTTSWTLSVAHSGTINWDITADGTITVDGLTSDKATLSVLATRTGYETVRKTWTLVKQKKGDKGNKGDTGEQGERGITADAIVGRPGQTWGFKSDAQGWSLRNGTATYSNGKMIFTGGSSHDVGIVSPTFTAIKGDENYAIRVRVRTTDADHSTSAELYYTTDSHGQTGSYYKSIPVEFKQNEWQYLVFDMRELTAGGSDWVSSDITRIRVDFSNAGTNRTYEIDGVVIGYFGAADETDYTDERVSNDVLQPPGIAFGAAGTIYLVKDSNSTLTEGSSSGEIGVSAGVLYFPDNTPLVVEAPWQLTTPFEGNNTRRTFFVVASKVKTRARFGSSYDQDAHLFGAYYENGQWFAQDNQGASFTLLPLATDVVVARGRRAVGESITVLETMIASADQTDYDDDRVNNGKLQEDDIRNGAGWAALPSSGATKNIGALADLDSIDLNNSNRTYNRLRLDRSHLESLNSRLTLGSDGFMVYKDENNQDVALGNVTPSGIGAAELDELIEASQSGGLFPDPTFRNLPSRGNDWYFSIWGDSGVPRSNITHDGSDLVWELLDTAQSGVGFTVYRGGATYYIPAKKGDTFAAKVILTADTEIINFAVQGNERNASATYAGSTTNLIPMQDVQGQRVELSGSATIQEETAAYIQINVRVNIPDDTHSIKIHSLQVYRISDAVANDSVDSDHIKGKMAWSTAPADGANKVELDGGGAEGQMRGRFNGETWFNVNVFSSSERTKLDRLRLGQMPGDSNKLINRWIDVDGDGRPDNYATVTGASSLAIDPTFERGFVSIDDPSDWHLEADAGEFDDAALVFHGNNTRDVTKYTWLAREPQNGNYLDIPAKKGDRFKFVIRYACWNNPVGNFGFNILGKDKNATNSEYLAVLNQGNAEVGTSATDFKTLETTIEISQSITKYVQFYFYANQNMTQGSILFDNVEIWKIPASIDNDKVDDNHIKGKMNWTNAPEDGANKTTNTNQLTDGAELGKKADWSGVTGTGKPADNANKIELYSDGGEGRWSFKTNGGTTQYIDVFSSGERTKLDRLRQGQLPNDATKYMNQWASVYGSGKPANDANKTDVDGGGAQGQMRYRLNNGSWVNVDVFSSDERTKLDNLRLGKLPDGSRDVLDRDLATLNSSGQSIIDSRANNRIDVKRPDSAYKNSNTTKSDVGLSNVDNKSSSTLTTEAINAALEDALLRNPSGEGINFFNPLYQNPLNTDLCRDAVNGELSVNTNYDFKQPSRGSVFRLSATSTDARFYMSRTNTVMPIKLIPGKKWIVSFWVLNNSAESAFSTNIYFWFKDTSGGYHHQGTSYDTPGAYSSKRVSCVIDMSGSTDDRDQATEVTLRLDVDKAGVAMVWDQIMIEPMFDDEAVPSPYRPPLTPAPILNAGNNLPMATLAGASATVKDISGGTYVLETAVYAGQAQIFINTHTVQLPDKEVTYNSDDITVSQNTRYFIFCDDPYGLGGSVIYYAVTSSQFSDLSAVSGRYWLGSITSASSSNPGGGDPGDYECVAADMYLGDGLTAGEVSEGQVIDAWSPEKGLHKHQVLACPDAVTECVRLITKGGAVVVSTTTPIDLKDGRTIAAINALGEELLTVSTEHGETWLPCIDIEYLEARRVIKINVGDESYPAGERPDFRIVTHNAIVKR